MKLTARDAAGFIQRPDLSKQAGLLYGPDAAYTANQRDVLMKAILGGNINDPFLLTELTPASLSDGQSVLLDALLARSLTGERSLVVLRGATDGTAKHIEAALSTPEPDANFLLVIAGNLATKSSLRKLFEKLKNTVTLPVYAAENQGSVILQALQEAGVSRPDQEASRDIEALGSMMEFGEAKQFAEILTLYALGMEKPLSSQDIADIAPAGQEDGMDRLAHLVAEGNLSSSVTALRRLLGQGSAAVPVLLAITRHFRRLHQVLQKSGEMGGVDKAIMTLRPPLFGRNKSRLQAQLRAWTLNKSEEALTILLRADQEARGGGSAAVSLLSIESLERTIIRLCVIARRKV